MSRTVRYGTRGRESWIIHLMAYVCLTNHHHHHHHHHHHNQYYHYHYHRHTSSTTSSSSPIIDVIILINIINIINNNNNNNNNNNHFTSLSPTSKNTKTNHCRQQSRQNNTLPVKDGGDLNAIRGQGKDHHHGHNEHDVQHDFVAASSDFDLDDVAE